MAAITYWVDPVSGNNANAGTSFATALADIDGLPAKMNAAGNGNDYTINMTNTGTHLQGNLNRIAVDNQTTSTFLIRGTDSSGNPAMATITPTGITSTSVSKAAFYIRENAGITVEYLRWDCAVMATSTRELYLLYSRDDSSGHLQTFRYCEFLGANVGSTPAGIRNIVTWSGIGDTQRPTAVIHDCYLQNMRQPLATSVTKWIMHHCVRHEVGATIAALALQTFANSDARYYNNTLYLVNTGVGNKFLLLGGAIKTALTSGSYNELSVYNNIVWAELTDAAGGAPTAGIFIGQNGTATISTGTVGYNILYTGPGLEGYSPLGMVLYDEEPFAASYPGDVIERGQAANTLFNDVNSGFNWTPEGSAVALSLPLDLRLIAQTTSGLGGNLPGALPAGSTDYSVQVNSTRLSPYEGESLVVRVAVSNAGTDSSECIVNVSVPAGLTVTDSSASSGTYAAGVWTITNLLDTDVETLLLTCTVDTGTGGTSLVVTATVDASSTPGAGGDLGDDTDSVTISVVADAITNPLSPRRVPFIDVLPLTQPVITLDLNTRLRTRRNRAQEIVIRSDKEDVLWSEMRVLRLEVAADATVILNLGGIQRGTYLFMEATEPVQLSMDGGTTFLPQAKAVVLSEGDFEQVAVKNPSVSAVATVLLALVD